MTVTFTAGQTLTAAAVNSELAFPTGIIVPYAGLTAPAQGVSTTPLPWLLCDGTPQSTTTYATLFSAIGYTYGGSGGSFNLPDMRGRMPMGAGTGTGLNASGTGAPTGSPQTARTLGDWGGEETHLNLSTESGVPAHNHTATDAGHAHSGNSRDYLFSDYTPLGGDNVGWGGTYSTYRGASWSTNTGYAVITVANNTAANASARHNNVPPFVVTNFLIKT